MFIYHLLFNSSKRVFLLGSYGLQENCLKLLEFKSFKSRFCTSTNGCKKNGKQGKKKLSLKNVDVSGKRVFMRRESIILFSLFVFEL